MTQRTIEMLVRWALGTAVLLCIGTVMCSGCAESIGLKRPPTEVQKQAAWLAYADLREVGPALDPDEEIYLMEAREAVAQVLPYFGMPKVLPQPGSSDNAVLLAQAAVDARRPDPTGGEVGQAVLDRVMQVSEVGFSLAELLLTGGVSIAGIFGAKKLATTIGAAQAKMAAAKLRAAEMETAVREIVRGVDAVSPEAKAAVTAIMSGVQSPATARLVADAKAEAV